MLSIVITTIIPLLEGLLPDLAKISPPSIAAIITALEAIIPVATSEIATVGPIIQNVISELQSNAAITPDQTATLTALDAQVDAAFEAAATAAGAPVDPASQPT